MSDATKRNDELEDDDEGMQALSRFITQKDEPEPGGASKMRDLMADKPQATEDMDLDEILARVREVRGKKPLRGVPETIYVPAMPNFLYNPDVDPDSKAYGMVCRVKVISPDDEIKIAFRSRAVQNPTDSDRTLIQEMMAGQGSMTADEVAFRWEMLLTVHYGTKAPRISLKRAAKMMSATEEKDGYNGGDILKPLFNHIQLYNQQIDPEPDLNEQNLLAIPEVFGSLYVAFREKRLIDFLSGDTKVVKTIRNNLRLLRACFKAFDEIEDARMMRNIAIGSGTAKAEDIEADEAAHKAEAQDERRKAVEEQVQRAAEAEARRMRD